MSKLLYSVSTPRFHTIHRHSLHLLSTYSLSPLSISSSSSSSISSPLSLSHFLSPPSISFSLISRRDYSVHAFDSDSNSRSTSQLDSQAKLQEQEDTGNGGAPKPEEFPSGEFQFKEFGAWKNFVVKCRMLVAFPWQRVKKGTVLTMKLRGQVFFQLIFLFYLLI